MAISIIPGKKRGKDIAELVKGLLGSYREFTPSIIVLAVVFALHVSVILFNNATISNLADVQEQKQQILTLIQSSAVQETQIFARRSRGLQTAINNQSHPSLLFDEFENSIHNSVLVQDFNIDTGSRELSISGRADSFETLGQQLLIWKNQTLFASGADVDQFSRDAEGFISFSATINVRQDYLR